VLCLYDIHADCLLVKKTLQQMRYRQYPVTNNHKLFACV